MHGQQNINKIPNIKYTKIRPVGLGVMHLNGLNKACSRSSEMVTRTGIKCPGSVITSRASSNR